MCHDRYFLDRVVDKLFVFTGAGHIEIYHGGYSDYEVDTNLTSAMGGDTKRGVLRHAVQVQGGSAGSRKQDAEYHANEGCVVDAESGDVQNRSRDTGIDVNTSMNLEIVSTTIDSNEGGKKKLTLGEMKELEHLELRIAELEGLVKAYDAMIAQGGSDYEAIESTIKEREQVIEELDMSTLRWLELEERK